MQSIFPSANLADIGNGTEKILKVDPLVLRYDNAAIAKTVS